MANDASTPPRVQPAPAHDQTEKCPAPVQTVPSPRADQHPASSLARRLNRISGKRQWLLWFTILTLLTALVAGWKLPLYVLSDSSRISPVIVLLFAGALMKSWMDICFLDRETRLASQQVTQLQRSGDIGAFVQEARDSLFKSHIAALHTIFLNDATIHQDNLVEVLHARLLARNKVVELFASVLITLGLIGTIVGLIGSVEAISTVLGGDGATEDSLLKGMTSTVGNLNTAFVTTLFGALFGGVVLRILTSVVDANILGYTAHLAELSEVYVIPAMRRTAARLQAAGYYHRKDNRNGSKR